MQYNYYITPEDYEKAEKNGINKSALEQRIRSYGWDIERATTEPLNKKDRVFTKEDIRKAKENGICYRTLLSRHSRGLTVAECISKPLRKMQNKEGCEYMRSKRKRKYPKEIIEKAAANGICPMTFYQRIHRYKWPLEKALTEPINKNYKRR